MAGYCRECGGAMTERDVDGRVRPVCAGCGAVAYLDPKLAVAVVIAYGDRILLGRRGAGTRNPGCWSFPAGFVERGERVEDAARREVREETGLAACLGPLLGLWSETGEAVVLAAYAASRGEGTPSPGDDLEEVAWFGLDELPELAFGHDREIIAAWRASGRQ
ncbi:MAG TPA: NUDIX hydrolase [Thermomicrobiales bacterium]|nr:NUDIX hydrolase [Thermomicrobiales bacterium]